RHRLELAAILQELREPLEQHLARVVADQFLKLVVDLAARPALLAAEEVEHLLGNLAPRLGARVQVLWREPRAGVANANKVRGQHQAASRIGKTASASLRSVVSPITTTRTPHQAHRNSRQ